MRLNANIIYEDLKERFQLKLEGKPRDDVLFGRPEFIVDDHDDLRKDHLYLGFSNSLPKQPSNVSDVLLLCFGGKPPAAYSNVRCIRLVFENSSDVFAVLNSLTNLFDKYDAWDESLIDAIEDGRNLSYVVEVCEKIFENPLLIVNRHFRYIAYSDVINHDPRLEEYRPEIDGTISLDRFSRGTEYQPVNTTQKEPIHSQSNFDLLSRNLFDNSRYIGCVTIVYANGKNHVGHVQLVSHLAERLESHLKRHPDLRYSENEAFRKSILNLIEGYPVETSEWKRALESVTESSFVCIKARPKDSFHDMPADYLCIIFEKNIPNCVALMYSDAIVAVANVDLATIENGSFETEVRNVLLTASLSGGVSDPYSDIMETRAYYREASIALEKCDVNDSNGYCQLFSDHILSYMIEHCSGEFSYRMTYVHNLARVVSHDADVGSEYVKTLKTYLDNNMNIAQTSRELYIHRTTLLSRLKSIEKLMKLELADPDIRLRLALNLRMIQGITNS